MTLNQNLKQAISLAIQGMVATNEDHQFEKLCCEFFKKEICDNTILSTGGGQGDGGEDFFTFPIYKNGLKSKDIAGACSLQNQKTIKDKIKDDIKTIFKKRPDIKDVYFFAGSNIAKSEQDKIKILVKNDYSINLNILDLQALSDQLSRPRLYDIVCEYLHIPSNIYPRPEEENWYSELYEKYKNKDIDCAEDLYEVISALREGFNNKDVIVDTEFWINRIEYYRKNITQNYEYKMRALYEEAWAYLRILGNINKFKDLAIEYVSAYIISDNIRMLEDGYCIFQYSLPSIKQFNFPSELFFSFRQAISDKVDQLSLDENNSLDKQALLYLKSLLALSYWGEGITNKHEKVKELSANYLKVINNLLDSLEELPFLSTDSLYDILSKKDIFGNKDLRNNFLFPEDEYKNIMERLDKITEKQTGLGIVGHKIKNRMINLIEEGDWFGVIEEGHKLKENWFQEDYYYNSVLSIEAIAKSYQNIGLYYASKYYYLLCVYACFRSEQKLVKEKMMRHIINVLDVEYILGNWFGYFNLLDKYFVLYYTFKEKAIDLKDKEASRLIVYAAYIKNLASFESSYNDTITGLIDSMCCDKDLKEIIKDDLQKNISYSLDEMWQKFQDEKFQGRPFKDMIDVYTINFNTSGIKWVINTKSCEENIIIAEEFVALLQIILAELHNFDIYHIKTDIILNVDLSDDGEITIEENGDNNEFEYKILLPKLSVNFDINDYLLKLFTNLIIILDKVSLLPQEKFKEIVFSLFKSKIFNKMCFLTSYRHAYTTIYKNDFEEWQNFSKKKLEVFNKKSSFFNKQEIEIFKYNELAPDFNENKIKKDIFKRYKHGFAFIAPTLKLLENDDKYKSMISELKNDGYMDWEIVMAFSNYLMNYKINKKYGQMSFIDEKMADIMLDFKNNPEKYNEPENDTSIWYNKEEIVDGLKFNQVIILPSLALISKTKLPKLDAIRNFLAVRYKYYNIDIDHRKLI